MPSSSGLDKRRWNCVLVLLTQSFPTIIGKLWIWTMNRTPELMLPFTYLRRIQKPLSEALFATSMVVIHQKHSVSRSCLIAKSESTSNSASKLIAILFWACYGSLNSSSSKRNKIMLGILFRYSPYDIRIVCFEKQSSFLTSIFVIFDAILKMYLLAIINYE